MKVHPAPDETHAELREPKGRRSERRKLPDDGVLTDEEAFYVAQEEAFAALRARHRARPRRKI